MPLLLLVMSLHLEYLQTLDRLLKPWQVAVMLNQPLEEQLSHQAILRHLEGKSEPFGFVYSL